jgi:hypothetical protein
VFRPITEIHTQDFMSRSPSSTNEPSSAGKATSASLEEDPRRSNKTVSAAPRATDPGGSSGKDTAKSSSSEKKPPQRSTHNTPSAYSRNPHVFWLVLPFAVTFYHVFFSPYTKVEETPALHAVHDILTHGISREALDNVSVHRTECSD